MTIQLIVTTITTTQTETRVMFSSEDHKITLSQVGNSDNYQPGDQVQLELTLLNRLKDSTLPLSSSK